MLIIINQTLCWPANGQRISKSDSSFS